MSDDFTLKVRKFDQQDPRLGRHVVHDSRSLRYAFRAAPRRKLSSVRHDVHIPILDQGNVGSCTGHAGTAAIASGEFWTAGRLVVKADAQSAHAYAVDLYSQATELDPWPGQYVPDDTGSDGLSIAKALQQRGLISGYQHALSLQDALAALAGQVVMIGSSWLAGMFDPGPDGRLTVSGAVAGGHEYALDEIDCERQRVWIRNSWGEGWGISGRAWMTWADLERLLADEGDCTVLVPLAEPAPQPTPAPEPKPDTEGPLAAALRKYLDNRNAAAYLRRAAEPWLKGR